MGRESVESNKDENAMLECLINAKKATRSNKIVLNERKYSVSPEKQKVFKDKYMRRLAGKLSREDVYKLANQVVLTPEKRYQIKELNVKDAAFSLLLHVRDNNTSNKQFGSGLVYALDNIGRSDLAESLIDVLDPRMTEQQLDQWLSRRPNTI